MKENSKLKVQFKGYNLQQEVPKERKSLWTGGKY
jgi:hypothetical protein